ncbi:MAG: CDP-diacylglycerol--glycerol-3-phosphate 3-phosphatidyltransferase [Pseudomonadota bacterium]
MGLPTWLTLGRIIMIPILVILFYMPYKWANLAATVVFCLAAATDWLDGFLARRLNQSSAFGAFLDPVADKLMVAVALVLLVQTNATPWFAVPAAVIIGREITVSSLREWMAEIGERAKVAVSWTGKFKTVAQMGAVIFLLYHDPLFGIPTQEIGIVLLYVAAVLTLWSMVMYLKAAWPSLYARRNKLDSRL